MPTRPTAEQLGLTSGMPLDPNRATASPEPAGNAHHFCSGGCKAAFEETLEGFVTLERTNAPGADSPCGRQG
jgi:YHS domain-containing protein